MEKVFSPILWLVLFCWHCLLQEGLNGAEISGHPYLKKKKTPSVDTNLTLFTKKKKKKELKMDHRPNYKCHTLKLLDDKIGENLDDPEYSHGFLDTTPKA